MKLRVEKTEGCTRLESDDGSLGGQVVWENDRWVTIYIDSDSGDIVRVETDEMDHWKLVGQLAVHLIKIGYGVVIP